LLKHTTKALRLRAKYLKIDFEIQAEIKSKDLDWEKVIAVETMGGPTGARWAPGPWDLEWIKLCRTDVTNVLCTGRQRRVLPTCLK
jgi:hypothetical protein